MWCTGCVERMHGPRGASGLRLAACGGSPREAGCQAPPGAGPGRAEPPVRHADGYSRQPVWRLVARPRVTLAIDFDQWLRGLDEKGLALWREDAAQMRRLRAELWAAVALAVAVQGGLVTAEVLMLRADVPEAGALLAVAGAGLLACLAAVGALRAGRRAYVDVVVHKALLERRLGFNWGQVDGLDASGVWPLPPRELERLVDNPRRWARRRRWRLGAATTGVLLAYLILAAMHALVAWTALGAL